MQTSNCELPKCYICSAVCYPPTQQFHQWYKIQEDKRTGTVHISDKVDRTVYKAHMRMSRLKQGKCIRDPMLHNLFWSGHSHICLYVSYKAHMRMSRLKQGKCIRDPMLHNLFWSGHSHICLYVSYILLNPNCNALYIGDETYRIFYHTIFVKLHIIIPFWNLLILQHSIQKTDQRYKLEFLLSTVIWFWVKNENRKCYDFLSMQKF
jgi:hypothetical protein